MRRNSNDPPLLLTLDRYANPSLPNQRGPTMPKWYRNQRKHRNGPTDSLRDPKSTPILPSEVQMVRHCLRRHRLATARPCSLPTPYLSAYLRYKIHPQLATCQSQPPQVGSNNTNALPLVPPPRRNDHPLPLLPLQGDDYSPDKFATIMQKIHGNKIYGPNASTSMDAGHPTLPQSANPRIRLHR